MNKKIKRSSKKTPDTEIKQPIQDTKKQNIISMVENDDKYRGFIENMPGMFYAVQPFAPYSPIYISRSFEMLGYTLDEWYESADMWVKIIHPDDRERILSETKAAMEAGKETDYEYRVCAKEGWIYWVRDRGCFISDENGNLICWQGIIIDITEQKRTEEALIESEVRYRALFENATDLIYIHDLKGNYLAMNEAAERVFGYTREEVLVMNIKDVVAPEQLKTAKQMLAKKLRRHGSGQTSYELDCITKDGKD